ncbi:uncharacterized protein LOC125854932 [Solanum stenotomum]|uniref:uncharacterized protein LOC125854932 n=1 Tax=Solanum stenotomum TaxID=172797 RepID=UPI0020D0866A|nr:uncharacterized protein LOC125854932 [Solanum stenotomum]
MEENILVTTTKLEKIFPCGFFDVMEHLPIHLVQEARLGGPVQTRWMYPFERKIGSSKQTIKQRGRIEGSFVQGHIGRETCDFYSYYFGHDVSCRRNRPNRNDEGDIDPLFPPISIFNQNGRGSKKRRKRGFTDMEMQSAVTHILLNCPEIQSYVNLFVNTWGNEAIYTEFSKWLRNYMSSGGDGDRYREHLGVGQTKQAKKKKSRRSIDPEDIAGSISSAHQP